MRINRIKFVSEMARNDFNVNDLTERCGISRGTISSVKNGKTCSPNTAKRIAEALNVELKYLTEEA